LYLRDELSRITHEHPNLRYCATVLAGGDEATTTGSLEQVVASQHPKLSGWRGFVCGDPMIVQKMKKKMFLAGMASREIFADAFIEAPAS
jgi:NAD(P)H-flavin reductase